MSNPVCVIHYFDEFDGWQFYGLTDCADTAAKMLLENGMIREKTGITYRQEDGTTVLQELSAIPPKDRVKIISAVLAGKGGHVDGWSLEACDVYDQDDYGAEDEYYGECICSSSL